jgi:Response regulator containing a CheY-like receiver domain and an HTH DNA-binding domain
MIRPRVLLADDHCLLLAAFKTLLEPCCEVVGTVTDGRQLLAAAPDLKPDVIVLDMAMPLLNGLEAGRRLKHMMPHIKLIYVTVNQDPDFAQEAYDIGASGYLLKSSAASELFHAIQEVRQGRRYITPLIAEKMEERFIQGSNRKAGASDLTQRQREVLQLLAEGHSMKQVAVILRVTPRTVAFHKYRIMEDYQLKSNADLVRFAIHQGTVSS